MKPVLYAEDDASDVFFLKYAWEETSIANPLIHLSNGEELISYLANHIAFSNPEHHPLPCLLILDLKLPRRNGFEVLRWMRQQPKLHPIKVVILSGSTHEAEEEMARALGVAELVVKPSVPVELVRIVQSWKERWAEDLMDEAKAVGR